MSSNRYTVWTLESKWEQCMEAWEVEFFKDNTLILLTLIARVQIAAITSGEPPRTQLSSWVGSYSQMAVAFLTAAIFVMCPITSMFPRLMTCPRQLKVNVKIEDFRVQKFKDYYGRTYGSCFSLLFHLGRPQQAWISAMVLQVVLLLLVLSKVAV